MTLAHGAGAGVQGGAEGHARQHGGPRHRVRRRDSPSARGVHGETPGARAADATGTRAGDAPVGPGPLDPTPPGQATAAAADGARDARKDRAAVADRSAAALVPPRGSAGPPGAPATGARVTSLRARANPRPQTIGATGPSTPPLGGARGVEHVRLHRRLHEPAPRDLRRGDLVGVVARHHRQRARVDEVRPSCRPRVARCLSRRHPRATGAPIAAPCAPATALRRSDPRMPTARSRIRTSSGRYTGPRKPRRQAPHAPHRGSINPEAESPSLSNLLIALSFSASERPDSGFKPSTNCRAYKGLILADKVSPVRFGRSGPRDMALRGVTLMCDQRRQIAPPGAP